jgi:small subunit ribosomal protein S4
MKRKHKLYSRPKTPFNKQRIIDEAKIKKDFGLKNKKEIWKANAKIDSFRVRAKKLVSEDEEKQKDLFKKLNKIGIKANSIADVLSLEITDWLKRRLQSIVFQKGLANTVKEARQLINHKKVLVDGRVVNIPSYIVNADLENKIEIIRKNKKEKKKSDLPEEVKGDKNEEIGKEEQ